MADDLQSILSSSRKYPHTFFDPLSFSVPNINVALQWSRRLYRTDPLIQGTIRKLATYPITNLVAEVDDKGTKHKVEQILKALDVRKFMMSSGIDYFTYGNVFVSTSLPIKRYAVCEACGKESDISEFKKISWRNDRQGRTTRMIPQLQCTSCETLTPHKFNDIPINNSSRVKLMRWDPETIEIKYNHITGNYMYIYSFPPRVKKYLLSEDIFYAYDTPLDFVNAAGTDKRIILDKSQIFHMRRESLGDYIHFWGEPIAFPILREIYYFYVNKKAQEILAHERIVPLRVMYPSNPGGVSPDVTINLGNWKKKMEDAIKKWRRDPNYLPIMPFPVGYESIGGEATRISIWPELNASQSRILLGLGVPPEFLVSGTWTGGSISVRMVENLLLNYRTEQENLVEFILNEVLPIENIDPSKVKVRLSNFKMADDIQFKQLLMNLNQTQKISDKSLLTEIGYDYEREFENVKADFQRKAELTVTAAKADAEAAALQMEGQGSGQAKANKAMQDTSILSSMGGQTGLYLPKMIQGVIMELKTMDPAAQAHYLTRIRKETPNLYDIIKGNLLAGPEPVTGRKPPGGNRVDKPRPDIKPPRRKEKTI